MGWWEGRQVLLVSPEPWEGLHLSKHHYALGLLEAGAHVVWMGPPEDVRKTFLEKQHDAGPDLLHYRHWLRGANRLPGPLRDLYYDRLFRLVQRLAGTAFDLVWCFDVSRFRRFPRGGAFGLLHLVDLDILYEGDALIRDADLVLTTTAPIRSRVLKADPRSQVHELGHALDEIWTRRTVPCPNRARPERVAYAGQLNTPYLDLNALRRMAEGWPGLTFDLYGPFDPDSPQPDMRWLLAAPNVVFHGLLSSDHLVGALQQADILLVCYRTGRLTEQLANPHKMLEYLSTGNVVVASDTLTYRERPELVLMPSPGEDLVATFASAVRDFEELNAPARRHVRSSYAHAYTMPKVLARIASLIDATGRSRSRAPKATDR